MERWQLRAFGALVGGLVPATAAAGAWWVLPANADGGAWPGVDDVAGLLAWGIPPGFVAGVILAPWAVATRWALTAAVGAAGLGVAFGILGVAISGAIGAPIAVILLLPVILVYGTLYGFPVALPAAWVAAVLLRMAPRHGRLAIAAAFVLVATTALLAGPALAYGDVLAARHQLSDLRGVPRLATLRAVRFEWQIANCSSWTYTLRATETHLDGRRSTREVTAPGGGVRRGVLELEPGWSSTIEADADAGLTAAWRGPHEVLRNIDADLIARIEISPNGERYLQARQPHETPHPGVPLCPLGASSAL
jgi:hypothetical protein